MLKTSVGLAILGALVAEAQLLAGNENYAQEARRSLRNAPQKRDGPTFAPAATSFSFGDKEYISPTGPEFKQYALDSDWGLDAYAGKTLPVTVFEVEGEVTCDVLGDKVKEYGTVDDVWDQGFMSAAVLTTKSSFHVAPDVAGCLSGWGGNLIIKNGNATSDVNGIGLAHVQGASVPPGPYLAKIDGGLTLTEVYRTYRDEAQAFTSAAVQTVQGSFADLTNPVVGLNTLTIPVPSRLYTKYLDNPRPLEGLRIGIKDLFDMAGLKTSGGSRAYFNTYPVKEVNSDVVQRLVDQGGIIVGRCKTSQFANGESATADWVDQLCPFNPRGDGYQQPSSSSSGPGAAQAAYDWLDHTIGSDTGGSVTGPASVGGTYGLRPTWNAISLNGVIPMQPTQDTAGFFARDAAGGAAFARALYGDKFGNYTAFPKTVILPNSSWTFASNYNGADQFNGFKSGLLDLLNPATVDTRSWEGYWNATGYFDRVGASASTWLQPTYARLIGYWQWNFFGKPWIADYEAQNDNRAPFIDPSPRVRWAYARDNVTEAVWNASLAQKATWKEFVDTQVLVSDEQTCSSAIYVEPITLGNTNYRDIYKTGTSVPFGFGYQAQFSGVPQLVVPIGQVAYESTITNHTEYLPIAITMFAANGCDYVLWDLAAALEKAGVTQPVAAGTLAYPHMV
ncbi:amidase signature enzyme [Papiliotrema laurentii]|uniref:Amidase signature enzyme n=1 Tax=Papiliotrema laurentii TaxID=5418 RepID=A0AAD9CXB8_PAPLA|nr:amidase signature enzyme [Papiliotrema laurentii]